MAGTEGLRSQVSPDATHCAQTALAGLERARPLLPRGVNGRISMGGGFVGISKATHGGARDMCLKEARSNRRLSPQPAKAFWLELAITIRHDLALLKLDQAMHWAT
jgi:hypothetical protein